MRAQHTTNNIKLCDTLPTSSLPPSTDLSTCQTESVGSALPPRLNVRFELDFITWNGNGNVVWSFV